MNVGKCRNRPKYICDKCKNEIIGYHKNSRSYKQPNKYYKAGWSNVPVKDFDLCDKCEKAFRLWLKETPKKNIIDMFERFYE